MRQQSALTKFATDAQTSKERLLRAAASGTFLDEPPEPAPDAPGYRSGSTGKFVGYGVDEHQATRATDTGRITDIGDPEPVPRSTLVARYGPPDGGESRQENNVAAPGQGVLLDEEGETGLDSRGIADAAVTAGAADRDVSLAPDEANRGVGAVGENTLGSFRAREGRQRAPSALEDPPQSAVEDQDRQLRRERRERDAESAGALDPSPTDPFDIAENTRRDVFSDDDIETLRDEFESATESFEEIDRSDADDFLDEAAFRKAQLPNLEKGDTLAVNTTSTLLAERRGGSL